MSDPSGSAPKLVVLVNLQLHNAQVFRMPRYVAMRRAAYAVFENAMWGVLWPGLEQQLLRSVAIWAAGTVPSVREDRIPAGRFFGLLRQTVSDLEPVLRATCRVKLETMFSQIWDTLLPAVRQIVEQQLTTPVSMRGAREFDYEVQMSIAEQNLPQEWRGNGGVSFKVAGELHGVIYVPVVFGEQLGMPAEG